MAMTDRPRGSGHAALLRQMASRLLSAGLSLSCCAACNGPLRRRAVFCEACASTVTAPAASETIAFATFGGAVADAIRQFKYDNRPDLARPLASLLLTAIHNAPATGAELLVPVPLFSARLVVRGYNQSALLAAQLAAAMGLPVVHALLRVRNTVPQARLDGPAARHRNVAGAFACCMSHRVAERHVLLVDDVCTTGATLAASGHALQLAGAASVTSCTIAATATQTSWSTPGT